MAKQIHIDYNVYSYHNSARNPNGTPELWAVRCGCRLGDIHSIHKDREKAMDVAVALNINPWCFETEAFNQMMKLRGAK